MPGRSLAVLAPTLALLAAASPAAAQDFEYGPPWILKGALPAPHATAARGGEVVLAEARSHRLLAASIPAGGLAAEPAWAVVSAPADPSSPEPLAFPQGVALDAAGNLYVADTGHDAVRLYRPGPAGFALDPGFAPGSPASDPRALDLPADVAVGPAGEVYVLDAGNGRILVADGPAAASWRVFGSGGEWASPSGIGVGADGTVWLADTGNHRVLGFGPAGATHELGRWGDEGGGLRYPGDVAADGAGRVYIADTGNHRVAVMDPAGRLHRSLGAAPLLAQPVRVDVDDTGRVWATDAANQWVVVWPGPANVAAGIDATPAFDGFLRDAPGDRGEEPWGAAVSTTSPDMLVRHAPDLDVARAERESLAAMSEEIPVYDRPNYLYFEVRNRGAEPFVGGAVGVWTRPPGGDPDFPLEWARAGARPGTAGAGAVRFAEVAYVAPGASAVVGPLVWTPASPGGGGTCDDQVLLMARVVQLSDPVLQGEGLEQARLSNNVVMRQLPVVPERCVPPGDRYERNDDLDAYAVPDEDWEHLAARCPRTVTRELLEPYPDTECPGIFEDGVAPRSAEEIFNLTIPNLTLHGTADRDFFRVALPDFSDPRWGLHDISPERIRALAGGGGIYEPQPMPECGAVQRVDFGPAGRDNTIWVSVSTDLVITAVPTDGTTNTLTDRTVGTAGEELRVYREGGEATEFDTPSPLSKRIVCPGELEDMAEIDLAFGDRTRPDGSADRRPLEALGGYEIRFTYLASIDRGIPTWVTEHNEGRGIRRIPCLGSGGLGGFGPGGRPPGPGGFPGLPGLPGAAGGFFDAFPRCGGGGPALIFPKHPQTPGLPDCIADGPGCMELSRFDWAGGRDLDLVIRAPGDLKVRLLGADGQPLAAALEVDQLPGWAARGAPEGTGQWNVKRLQVRGLEPGGYYLQVEGAPTEYAIEYLAPQPPGQRR